MQELWPRSAGSTPHKFCVPRCFILPATFPKMEIIFNITENGGKAAFSFAKWQRGKWRLAGLQGCFSRWTQCRRQWDGHQHAPGPATTIVLLGSPEGDSGS